MSLDMRHEFAIADALDLVSSPRQGDLVDVSVVKGAVYQVPMSVPTPHWQTS